MDRSLNFSEGPTKEEIKCPSVTTLPRIKRDEAHTGCAHLYTDQPCMLSLNVTYCLHYYPTLITAPSPNSPPSPTPLDSLLHLESSVDHLKAYLLLKAQLNH